MHDSDAVAKSSIKKSNPPGEWSETPLGPFAASLDPNTHRFLARQAIFDRRGEVHGYELLFRLGSDNHFAGDSDAATRTMVDNWLLHGFDELTGGSPSFVNCTREALVEGLVTLLPSSWAVLELLETVEPDEEVVSACRRMKRLGYGIALDDFQFSKKMERLVELADYVKIDFRLPESLRRTTLRQLEGCGVKLLAEKVETKDELKIAFGEGFELFQGYFFGRPTVFSKRKTPAEAGYYRRLLETLTESWCEADKMIRLVKSEASICHRLLRLANSAAFGLGDEVRSIEEAMVMIGEDQFRMLTMLSVGTETRGERAGEFLLSAPRRAAFLELTAPSSGRDGVDLLGQLSRMRKQICKTLSVAAEAVMNPFQLRREMNDLLMGMPKGRSWMAKAW
jgi:EAL and modified HD-GYP domain-containing signal transduction protein